MVRFPHFLDGKCWILTFHYCFFFLLCEMFIMSKNTKCEIHNVPYVLPSFFFLSHNGCHGKVWRLKKIPPFESCLLEKNWLLWNILKKCEVKCIYPAPGEKTATSFKKNRHPELVFTYKKNFPPTLNCWFWK